MQLYNSQHGVIGHTIEASVQTFHGSFGIDLFMHKRPGRLKEWGEEEDLGQRVNRSESDETWRRAQYRFRPRWHVNNGSKRLTDAHTSWLV